MVRIVAGIDFEHYPNALAFVGSLAFTAADVRLIHVVESVLPDRSFPNLDPTHPLSILMEENERNGSVELDKAGKMLEGTGYQLAKEIHRGDPARSLLEHASSHQADIIAVGSAQKGSWASLFFGSVTKALITGAEQSILVAKSRPRSQEGLHAVLAFDNSPYCNACVDRFVEWDTRGIKSVTVLNAQEQSSSSAEPSGDEIDGLRADINSEIDRRMAKICERLTQNGIEASYKRVSGHPNQAIEDAMRETEADLLVIGARGHGFWDRLRIGSVSHFQVVATPHNVLVIRV